MSLKIHDSTEFLKKSCQPGVISPAPLYATYTTVFLKENFEMSDVKKAISCVPALTKQFCEKHETETEAVIGVEPSLWRKIYGGKVPKQLHEFRELTAKEAVNDDIKRAEVSEENDKKRTEEAKENETNSGLRFPKSGGDLFLYTKGVRVDLTQELARLWLLRLKPHTLKFDQTIGWKYLDSRDLSGFVDGTRNPIVPFAIVDAALIQMLEDDDEKDSLGGSFCFTSKWTHDLDKFNSLSAKEKSETIGRDFSETLVTSLGRSYNKHLPDSLHALGELTAHAKRYHINRGYGGMYRQSLPCGTFAEPGLFFIAFTGVLSEIDNALHRMLGLDDGLVDRIFIWSKPLTANYWYCPSLAELKKLAEEEETS
jgi:putative iron-dependent peroxidase